MHTQLHYSDSEATGRLSTNQNAGSETDCHTHPHGHEWIPVPNGRQPGKKFTGNQEKCLPNNVFFFQVKIVDDMQPTGENMPYMKAEDAQYFQKLLVGFQNLVL